MPAWAPSVDSVQRSHADFFPDAPVDTHQDAHHDFIFGGGAMNDHHDHHTGDSHHHHMATAHVVGPHVPDENGNPFEIPPDSVLDAMKAVLEGQEEEMKAAKRAHLDSLTGAKVAAAAPTAAAAVAPSDLRMAESGFHIDISPLKILAGAKTAVLVTGGMASKLFGLGMIGFMAFQAIRQARQEQEQEKQRLQGYGPRA